MTRKKRIKQYKEALFLVNEAINWSHRSKGLCGLLGVDYFPPYSTWSEYPEVELFKPTVEEKLKDFGYNSAWWFKQNDHGPRAIVLELAILMAEDSLD